MNTKIRTAIFPVAGLGTRLLPATISVPKELMPIINTPLIQFAVDEAREAGIERLVFVSHPSKLAIEKYLRHDTELHDMLSANGNTDCLEMLNWQCPSACGTELIFTMQGERKGLGHAVLCGRGLSHPGPVAVVLPDDLIFGEPGCLVQMIKAYEENGSRGHMVATMDVAPTAVSSYGILSIAKAEGQLLRANGIVEKPTPETAPSTDAVVGRYILDETIFDALAQTPPGAGGEIQLTDAIAAELDHAPLLGFRFRGQRFDCGNPKGLLAATVARASVDPDLYQMLGEQFVSHRFAAE